MSGVLPSFEIKPATETDVALVLAFVNELADYENLSHEAVATEAGLHAALFGERKVCEAVIGYEAGRPVGFALFFHNYSTFAGKPGLYLEDLYVQPAYRGRGYGKALLVYLAKLAKERGCGRFEWSVLDWNEPSIQFYKKLGAIPMDEWTIYRVTGEALDRLAQTGGD